MRCAVSVECGGDGRRTFPPFRRSVEMVLTRPDGGHTAVRVRAGLRHAIPAAVGTAEVKRRAGERRFPHRNCVSPEMCGCGGPRQGDSHRRSQEQCHPKSSCPGLPRPECVQVVQPPRPGGWRGRETGLRPRNIGDTDLIHFPRRPPAPSFWRLTSHPNLMTLIPAEIYQTRIMCSL